MWYIVIQSHTDTHELYPRSSEKQVLYYLTCESIQVKTGTVAVSASFLGFSIAEGQYSVRAGMRKPRFKMVPHLIHRTAWHQLLRIFILPHPQTRDHNRFSLIGILYDLDEGSPCTVLCSLPAAYVVYKY